MNRFRWPRFERSKKSNYFSGFFFLGFSKPRNKETRKTLEPSKVPKKYLAYTNYDVVCFFFNSFSLFSGFPLYYSGTMYIYLSDRFGESHVSPVFLGIQMVNYWRLASMRWLFTLIQRVDRFRSKAELYLLLQVGSAFLIDSSDVILMLLLQCFFKKIGS